MIVETIRSIIDAVKPTRTFFTLETMPWAYPDSPDTYLRLFKAIDRKQFAVHLDPVNLVCSPQRYYGNGATDPRVLREARPLHQELPRQGHPPAGQADHAPRRSPRRHRRPGLRRRS